MDDERDRERERGNLQEYLYFELYYKWDAFIIRQEIRIP